MNDNDDDDDDHKYTHAHTIISNGGMNATKLFNI